MVYCSHSHGRAESNCREKETHKTDGDLRILLDDLCKHGFDKRIFDLPALAPDSGPDLTVDDDEKSGFEERPELTAGRLLFHKDE